MRKFLITVTVDEDDTLRLEDLKQILREEVQELASSFELPDYDVDIELLPEEES